MTWQTETIPLLRSLISDDVPEYTYSDSRLSLLLVNAANLVNNEVDFSTTYTISVLNTGISPDPTVDGDQSFINLTALRAACLVAGSEQKSLALGAVKVVDGPSQIDLSSAAKEASTRLKMACDAYTKAKLEFIMNKSNAGHVIFSASRTVESICPDGLQ